MSACDASRTAGPRLNITEREIERVAFARAPAWVSQRPEYVYIYQEIDASLYRQDGGQSGLLSRSERGLGGQGTRECSPGLWPRPQTEDRILSGIN